MSWGVADLQVSFAGAIALRDVTLPAPESVVTAVIGGDGAGKTTLLRALVGALVPDRGSVVRPARREIGYMPSSAGSYGDLTVFENLAFVGRAFSLGGRELDRRTAVLLDRTGLAPAADRLAAQLSGGMRRKLALALALLHEPGLLVLDEPTTGVDPVSRVELWRLIAATAAGGAAVVLSTTYVDEAERAGNVLVLDLGRALASGAPEAVIGSIPGSVGRAARRPAGPAFGWRRGAGWRIWAADGCLPAGAIQVTPDLEDAVTVFCLQAERAEATAA